MAAVRWRVSSAPALDGLARDSGRRAFWSAFATLNLAVMGNSVLPMPAVISRVGVFPGCASRPRTCGRPRRQPPRRAAPDGTPPLPAALRTPPGSR